MKLEQSQKNDFALMCEIGIQLKITVILKMVESIGAQINEIEDLYKIMKSKKRWMRL